MLDLLWDLERRGEEELEFFRDSFRVVEPRDPLLKLRESTHGRWAGGGWFFRWELLNS